MKKVLCNKKAQVETSLNFLLKLILFMVIIGSAVFIYDRVALSSIKAENSARNLGTTFDALALTPKEVEIAASCPSDVQFTIEGAVITANVSSPLGNGIATYNYLHENNAILPQRKEITCSSGQPVTISKTYNSDLQPVITVSG